MKEIIQTAVNKFRNTRNEAVVEMCLTLCEPEYQVAAPKEGSGELFDLVKVPKLETVRFSLTRESYLFVLADLVRLGKEMEWVKPGQDVTE